MRRAANLLDLSAYFLNGSTQRYPAPSHRSSVDRAAVAAHFVFVRSRFAVR
jgi:hypothetical protein